MIKHGNPPFLECSSRGDKRFSPFFAYVNGRSIEARYQAAKVFEDGTTGLDWRAAKGRVAVNQEILRKFYSVLWDTYIAQHSELLAVLKAASGVCDMFGQPGCCCQATELWRIRNAALGVTEPEPLPDMFGN